MQSGELEVLAANQVVHEFRSNVGKVQELRPKVVRGVKRG